MLAMTIEAHIRAKTRFSKFSNRTIVAFLFGSFGAHFALMGADHIFTFPMSVASDSPIVLRSTEWPQKLYVSSEKLTQALLHQPDRTDLPVTVEEVTDYGCIRTFAINTVDGVDVKTDADAAWTLRTEDLRMLNDAGPGNEDHKLPWCAITFYRTK
jgi:hypothetical protein